MEKKEVVIKIDSEGKVTFDVQGVKGDSCLALTKDIEESLGGSTEPHRELKDSYYETEESAYVTGDE